MQVLQACDFKMISLPLLMFRFYFICFGLILVSAYCASAQSYKLSGKVMDAHLEPLSFVTVQISGLQIGTRTNEKGEFEFMLEEGEYELVFSLIGFQKQQIKLLHRKLSKPHQIILDEKSTAIHDINVVAFRKDKAEEIVRQVIQHKNSIVSAGNSFSAQVYIRATDETHKTVRNKNRQPDSASATSQQNMNMAEVYLETNYTWPDKIKEKRNGVDIRGDATQLFYLSTTEGDFSLYNNLMQIPALCQIPMLSPLSYSGLVAYKYKTKSIQKKDGYTIYSIQFSPTRLGNALIEGDMQIIDTSWAIVSAQFRFPAYHMTEYNYFEATQRYDFVDDKAWLPVRQEFNYTSKAGRNKSSGRTVVVYDQYHVDTQFSKKHFTREISATSIEAYDRDSSFWNTVRKEPLNESELKFIHQNDSIYRATHSKAYLDSIDRETNKITFLKLAILGQDFYNRKREEYLSIDPVTSMYRPLLPGGARVQFGLSYSRIFPTKKSLDINAELSYGFLNRNIMGDVTVTHRYNPFSNGYIRINTGRDFDFIFWGDAYINLFRRSNFYINNNLEIEHGLEIANGLILRNQLEFSKRESLEQLTLNRNFDSVFTFNNDPISFPSYHSTYLSTTLEYTPNSNYIREPHQKIILGSTWPTCYVKWRKGIPNVFKSEIDFDYLEFGLFQKLKLGLAGISQYRVFTGSFITQRDLRYIDYKFISQGNPFLFNNPLLSFQALDSTFPVFKRFYEGHYLHRFNGALLNKIPLVKRLKLLEVAGGGVLIIPERNLWYAEAFAGIEKIIPIFRERVKLGMYYVMSVANKYNNPYQLKFGLDVFNRRRNTWH
jgi:hypothetical protein